MKCVITAGPSAGKTSTLRELSVRGYKTAPEAARVVIDQYISEGGTAEEVRLDEPFQEMVAEKQREIESNMNVDDDEIVFMDRSIIDGLAFGSLFEHQQYLGELEVEGREAYDMVFRLEQLPFEDDYARTESSQESREVHEKLLEVYEDLGYDVIDIPLGTVSGRADTIEERVMEELD